MKFIDRKQVEFFRGSIADDAGKVFFFENRVFRAIFSDSYAQMYSQLLKERWVDDVFRAGLIRTVVSDDIKFKGAAVTFEHKKIPFMTHPAENTAYMFWLSAKTLVRVNLLLAQHGYILKDAHPWNVMLEKGSPKFIDFTSIIRCNCIPVHWFKEFKKYFCIPIWLASLGCLDFSREYRREHLNGFGLKLFENRILNKAFIVMMRLGKFCSDPVTFMKRLDKWLDKHKPKRIASVNTSQHEQKEKANDNFDPVKLKLNFFLKVLTKKKPLTVLDCAANNGCFSEMAAYSGASVASLNDEERCTNECLSLAQNKNLDITPAVMDFKLPTPPHSIGLLYGDAYERFKSEIVLAFGLAHYLCIVNRLPVHIFCHICMKYATKGVLFEYVDPMDTQVKNLRKQIPENYSLEEFNKNFSAKFPKTKMSTIVNDYGIKRALVHYYC
jgi:hypothetical protein